MTIYCEINKLGVFENDDELAFCKIYNIWYKDIVDHSIKGEEKV